MNQPDSLYNSLDWKYEHIYFPKTYLQKYIERLNKSRLLLFKGGKYYLEQEVTWP